MDFITKHYDSISELAAIKRSDIPVHNLGMFDAITDNYADNLTKRQNWFGLNSAAEVEAVFKNGWADGVDRMMQAFGQINADVTPTCIKRVIVRGDHGDELDIHRVNSGSLGDAWTRRKRMRRASPSIVKIGVSANMSYRTKADEMFWRGAAALRLADILTAAGYAVEIEMFQRAKNTYADDIGSDNTVTIKHSSDQLDVQAVASTICLAGFYRLYVLRAKCANDKVVNADLGQAQMSYTPDDIPAHLVLSSAINNRLTAQQWLDAALSHFINQ
jgi:hypothetical protein